MSGVEFAFKAWVVDIRGVRVIALHLCLPFHQKSKSFPRNFQHASTYISLAKLYLNTRQYLGGHTDIPNKIRILLAKKKKRWILNRQLIVLAHHSERTTTKIKQGTMVRKN